MQQSLVLYLANELQCGHSLCWWRTINQQVISTKLRGAFNAAQPLAVDNIL